MRTWAVLLLAACSGGGGTKLDGGVRDAPDIEQIIPVSADLDLLFVIDNSSGMSDKQTVFAANFPKLVQQLDAFPTGRPNLHIGVVSSTVDIGVQGFGPGCPSPAPNDNGLLQNTPRVTGCSPPTGRFISDVKNSTGGRTTNYSGTLDAAFSCIAQVGGIGCGFEAPLEAMKRALDGSRPENAGFLRPNAVLAIVILTDEDDCSVADNAIFGLPESDVGPGDFRCQPLFAYSCDQPISATTPGTYTNCHTRTDSYLRDPAAYFQFLETLKPPGNSIVIATVTGDPKLDASGNTTITTTGITTPFNQTLALAPSCMATINGNPTIARAGIRIAGFTGQAAFGLGRQYSICQSDYSAALTDLGQMLFSAVSPCILGSFSTNDTDPNNPGVQLACTVKDVENPGTSSATTQILPACTMSSPTTVDPSSPTPCWWTDANATSCPTTTSHFEINFKRSAAPPAGTVTEVKCAS